MKLTKKLIQDIVKESVGDDGVIISDYLQGKKNVSEFVIAEKLNVDLHIVRNILYRMHAQGLVLYYRKKDRQKGWYISYWTFNPKRVKELVPLLERQKLENYRKRLAREEENEGNFYICPNFCKRLEFENAIEHDFKCPECGSLLNLQDNSRTIEVLRQKIKDMGVESED